MKTLLTLALFLLNSCSDKLEPKEIKNENLSTAEKTLVDLVDSFKTEYISTDSPILKDSLINKYHLKLSKFLTENYIDSIEVHVDSVILNGWEVTTQFHCKKDIEFKGSLVFKEGMTKKQDSLFQFMKGLKPNTDTMVNFDYIGSHQINDPSDTSTSAFRIFAFPSPIYFKKQ